MRKLMLVAIVVLSLIAMPATVLAEGPEFMRWQNSGTFQFQCDASYNGVAFNVVNSFTVDVHAIFFKDNDGNVKRVKVDERWDLTAWNDTTMETIYNHASTHYTYDYVDGTITMVGLVDGVNIPGVGIAFLNVGRTVNELLGPFPYSVPGALLFEAGHHAFLTQTVPEVICPLLS